MKVKVVSLQKKKGEGEVELADEIFKAAVKPVLLAQYVRVYLSNQRRGTAKVKDRGEVKISGKKIWRQKGSGRARHGDKGAPIFVGGGIAHGPKPKDWNLKMSKKMKKKALFGALTNKMNEGSLIVVDGLTKIKGKTKEMTELISNIRSKANLAKGGRRILVVLPEMMEKVLRAGRNIPDLETAQAGQLNAYQVLRARLVILDKKAVGVLREVFLKSKS